MKLIINLFTNGLVSDMHPLTTDDKGIVDALNATLITYNGNEMILQNDMGNTLILDSATGNIMGLSPGFIPIGLKEHGGVMYIASVNKEGNGEIGTIPSPIIRDIYKQKITCHIDLPIPIGVGDPLTVTHKLYPADKFIANLLMEIEANGLKGIQHKKNSDLSLSPDKDPCDIILSRQCLVNPFNEGSLNFKNTTIYSPIISYASDSQDDISIDNSGKKTIQKKGIYSLNLYSTYELGKSIMAGESLCKAQVYSDNAEKKSQYWFLHTSTPGDVFPSDLFNATLNKSLKQVPTSNKPGQLAVKLVPEKLGKFGMLPRQVYPHNTPITYKTTDNNYYTFFPGFYYYTDSGLYIEQINAKVIDESTGKEVTLIYPFDENKSFGRFDLSDLQTTTSSNSLFTGKFWEPNDLGFPHVYSDTQDDLEAQAFILSPILGVYDHDYTKSKFVSSTEGVENSSHSGMFYAELGTKYNNWYRLEVTYKDQYGGNEGTFTTRFNPYLNDVFGTNLGLTDSNKFKYADMLKIGYNYHELDTTNVNEKFMLLECIYSKEPHIGYGDTFNTAQDYIITNGLNGFSYAKATFKKNESDYYPLSTVYNCVPRPHDLLIKYLGDSYAYVYLSPKVTLNATISQKLISGYFLGSYFASDNVECFLFFETPPIGSDKTFKVGNSVFYSETAKFLNADDPFTINWSKNLSNTYFPLRVNLTVSLLPSAELISFNTNVETADYNWVQILPIPSENQILLSISDLYGNRPNGDPLKLDTANFQYRVPYTHDMGCKFTFTILPVLETIKSTIEANIAYGITPYFILQGLNDSGNQVYVLRFNGMTFEHNFLYDSGKLVNHIKELFSKDDIIKASPCSYNEQTPFKYVDLNYTSYETMTLKPGIYVLNIQRCPGVSNWTLKGDNTTLLRLEIQVDDHTYTYDLSNKKTSIKNWSISALDTNGTVYEPAGYSRMRIYTPIVIVVNSNKPVSIKIDATKPDGHKFTRQSMGLHQIKDITENDILSLNIDKEVYLYHDYMNLIKESSNRLSEVKQYAFIQKYGVFFKEAFVFVDGVFNDENKQVEDITIGEKTYEAWPYIPSDTSILPVGLQKDNNYYWNTYYMPKSILSENSENSEFIFSNADDISIITTSLKPINGGILRQLINQE